MNTDSLLSKARNDISNLRILYNHSVGKSLLNVNAIYSLYRLCDTVGISYIFTNAAVFCALEQKNSGHHLSLNYFKSNEPDSIATDALIFEYQISFRPFNKLSIISGLRYSFDKMREPTWGGVVSADYEVTKSLSIKLEAERMVQGDFYNNFNTAGIENFPYLLSTSLTFNLDHP
jgi:hypothetical protein